MSQVSSLGPGGIDLKCGADAHLVLYSMLISTQTSLGPDGAVLGMLIANLPR